MTKKNIFLVLAILGFLAPYYFFVQIPPEDLMDISSLVQPLFATSFMKGLSADPTVTLIVFWVFVLTEASKIQMKNAWIYLLAPLLVGLSFALPLFLYFRERRLETT